MSYGIDVTTQWRQAASYVDRVLRGANPADLPFDAPTKYETVVNLKTAKTLGFEVPANRCTALSSLLALSGIGCGAIICPLSG